MSLDAFDNYYLTHSISQRTPSILNLSVFYVVGFFFLCQNPLAMDLVLNLPNDGIRLVFDPVTQRLKVYIFTSTRGCTQNFLVFKSLAKISVT